MKEPFDLPLMSENKARLEVAKIMADSTLRVPRSNKLLRTLMMERARRVAGHDRERFLDERPRFSVRFLLPGVASALLFVFLMAGTFTLQGRLAGPVLFYVPMTYLVLIIGLQAYVIRGAKSFWNARDTELLKNILGRQILKANELDFSEYGIDAVKASNIVDGARTSARDLNSTLKYPIDLFNAFAFTGDVFFSLWKEVDKALDEPLWEIEKTIKGIVTTQDRKASS